MTEEAKKKAAKKAPAKTKAEAPAKKAATKADAGNPGRQPKPETIELLDKMTKLAGRKGGISNIEVAGELGVTTLKASTLGRRLVARGALSMVKDENGRVSYARA